MSYSIVKAPGLSPCTCLETPSSRSHMAHGEGPSGRTRICDHLPGPQPHRTWRSGHVEGKIQLAHTDQTCHAPWRCSCSMAKHSPRGQQHAGHEVYDTSDGVACPSKGDIPMHDVLLTHACSFAGCITRHTDLTHPAFMSETMRRRRSDLNWVRLLTA